MNSVNFYRTYQLDEIYEHVKEKSGDILAKNLIYPDLYQFNDEKMTLTFKSERLVPTKYTGRPRVMLLFSNPHPHSVHQGMLLSPNTRGKENPFWETMRNAGWIDFKEETEDPLEIANLCFNVAYEGPFDFVFYPYYTFPTNYPNEIRKIFGKEYFNKVIKPEAKEEFKNTVQETRVEAVLAFNKEVFNLVSETTVEKYINNLINGELVRSRLKVAENNIPTYLTFPTGWRYHKEIKQLRKKSLDLIKIAILKA
jgi:hypothetical protein